MAAFQTTQGFACEFVVSVPDYLHCKACNLVARRLTLTSCCGESYCHACIADTQKQGKPCPACGEKDFSIFGHRKNQKQINSLLVCCSLKERGCDWSGTLKRLNTHLDPDQDNCQCVDTKCPLNCQKTVPKNKVEQHVAQECTKRPHVCQHCGFKATYEEVVDTHFPECGYVPLQCPNRCGVTCERGDMEDHMKICQLEEIACEFGALGCDIRFRREDQEEHTRQNSQKHLALIASLAMKTKEQLQQQEKRLEEKHIAEKKEISQKIEEQERKLQEQHDVCKAETKALKQNLKAQAKIIQDQAIKLVKLEKIVQEKLDIREEEKITQLGKFARGQEKIMQELKKRLGKMNTEIEDSKLKLQTRLVDIEMECTVKEKSTTLKFDEQKKKLENYKCWLEHQTDAKFQNLEDKFWNEIEEMEHKNVAMLHRMISLRRTFEMNNFGNEKAKESYEDWKSPAMYTHVCGYKFCIGVDANGYGSGYGKFLCMDLWAMSGEYDSQLRWPARVKLTIELVNQYGEENRSYSADVLEWDQPTGQFNWVTALGNIKMGQDCAFLDHSELDDFLVDDTLYFRISKIEL